MNDNAVLDIRRDVKNALAQGIGMAEVFKQFNGKIEDEYLAKIIAAYPDPELCKKHRLKAIAVVIMAIVQAVCWGLACQESLAGIKIMFYVSGVAVLGYSCIIINLILRNEIQSYVVFIVVSANAALLSILTDNSYAGKMGYAMPAIAAAAE